MTQKKRHAGNARMAVSELPTTDEALALWRELLPQMDAVREALELEEQWRGPVDIVGARIVIASYVSKLREARALPEEWWPSPTNEPE
jgi:hypothetical protein